MVYLPSIPQPTDTLANSQPQILSNFTLANTYFGVDHGAFDAVSKNGLHKKCSFIGQPFGVVPVTLDGITLEAMSTVAPAGLKFNLFYRENNFGITSNQVQLTGTWPPVPIASPVVGQFSGCSNLPGGLMIQWGYVPPFGPGVSPDIEFVKPFSVNPYSVVLSAIKTNLPGTTGDGIFVYHSSVTPTKFNAINKASGPHDIYWVAIGPEISV